MRSERGGWSYYLAKGKGRVGVLVVHEIFGYSSYVEKVASDLATAGFSAAAVDLFRGKSASNLEEGFKLRSAVTRDDAADCVAKGAELLREDAGAEVVGTLGFCMGGGFALQTACELSLPFCVDYYGSVEDEAAVARLGGPLLLILGSEDERVTPWAFQKLLPAAAKLKKRVEVQLYPGARHAFHRPGWDGHNPEAARDAWEKTLRFLSSL